MDNPLAMVEHFHTTIKTIINGPLKQGLFGDMRHHYGTIEYQGRGTPHIHLAIWIKGTMTHARLATSRA
jgi:Helitron helicase-like domain at N-terminus